MLLAPCAQLRFRNVSKSGSHTLTLTRARASISGTFLLLLTLECTGLAGAAASAHASHAAAAAARPCSITGRLKSFKIQGSGLLAAVKTIPPASSFPPAATKEDC